MTTILKPHLVTDFYKIGHVKMYPKGMEFLYSNFTPRSTKWFPAGKGYDGKIVFVGLQGFLKTYTKQWEEEFFSKNLESILEEYISFVSMGMFLPKDQVFTKHIEDLHKLGYLPLEIKALKEGSVVPAKIPLFTIQNTVSGFGWLVNYLETVLSNALWKPCVNATIAREYRHICDSYAEYTGSPMETVDWQCHDFSYRGLSCPEDGMYSGFAHLTSFKGTDTVPAILYASACYGVDEGDIYGGSVYATEHSVACANIAAEGGKDDDDSRYAGEVKWLRRYITEVVPTGIASYVADTYDFWGVLTKVLPEIKDEIMARDGRLVVRPDSGCPVKIVTGYKLYRSDCNKKDIVSVNGYIYNKQTKEALLAGKYEAIRLSKSKKLICYEVTKEGEDFKIGKELQDHEVKGAVEVLYDLFGGTQVQGASYKIPFKVLDTHIGLIYGDSITLDIAKQILARLSIKGFASCNVVFGVGSFTYQYNTRDSLGFAMKATAMTLNGKVTPLQKEPKTGDSLKKSAKGLLGVLHNKDGEFALVDAISVGDYPLNGDCLELTYYEGEMMRLQTLTDIRERIKSA